MSVLRKRGLATVGKGVRQGKNYFVLVEVMRRRHVGNRCCTSFCKCFNCDNRPPGNNDIDKQSSCRCGANNKNGGEEVKSCTDTIGKRRTKCKCYKEMRPCTNKCGCYGCSNEYGRREASNVSSPQKR